MNATIEALKKTESTSAADVEGEYRKVALLAFVDISFTDPQQTKAVLEAAGKSIGDLEQTCKWLKGRQQLIDELAAADEAKIEAERLGREYETVAAELKRISEPLREKLGDLARRKEELIKQDVKVSQNRSRLAQGAPAWVEAERRATGRLLTAKRERVPHIREAIAARNQRIAAITPEIAKIKQKIQPVAAEDRFIREIQENNSATLQSRLTTLEEEKRTIESQLKTLQSELPTVQEECKRLETRAVAIDHLAMFEIWPLPQDLEEHLAATA